jgi:hypothetical protein
MQTVGQDEKSKQKLQKFTRDEIRPDREGEILKKAPFLSVGSLVGWLLFWM